MPYADYAFYRDAFGGTRLTEEEFQPAALRAAAYLDAATAGAAARASGDRLNAVKMANCDLAEVFADEAKLSAGVTSSESRLSSETVGSWSRVYQSESVTAAELDWVARRKTEALLLWLGGTGLLRAKGVPRCSPCSRIR